MRKLRLASCFVFLAAHTWAAGVRDIEVPLSLPQTAIPVGPSVSLPELSLPTLGTPGAYAPAFQSDLTEPRISRDIESGRFVKLEADGGALKIKEAGEKISAESLKRVETRAAELSAAFAVDGAQIMLVEAAPESVEAGHPHLLAVTRKDYQAAHAAAGRLSYMTLPFFTDAPSPSGPLPEAFGERHVAALEKISDLVRGDLKDGRSLTPFKAPEPGAWAAIKRGFSRAWDCVRGANAPENVPYSFKLVNGAYYYHGTTMFDLIRIVEGGGLMAKDVSQFSMLARDSVGYAGSRQYNLGKPDNPTVMLQFKNEDIADLVTSEPYRAAAAMIDRGIPPNHQSYAAAKEPVPLSLMTQASKESIMRWLRIQAVRYPEQSRWRELIPKFEAALYGASVL